MVSLFNENLPFLLFVLFLSIFLYFKRKNLQVSGSFPFLYMMMYKTSLGLNKMKQWSKKHPNFFLYLAYLSIFVGIVGMLAIFVFMFWQLNYIQENNIQTGGGLVLPIKTEKGLDSAVPVFYVPFWYWIISLFILVVVHEFAHGVIAERFNIKIKSSGFAFLGIFAPILPAAFVEPDEKQLKKKPRWQQIAVFGAGSTSNFIFGFLFLFLSVFIISPIVDNITYVEGITFSSIMNESSLNKYNVSSGEVIEVNNLTDKKEILLFLSNIKPNETINLKIKNLENNLTNTYEVLTFNNPNNKNKGMIGISGIKTKINTKEEFSFLGNLPLSFLTLINYIWLLNIAIGIMNLMPIWITDGGQIAKSILEKYFKRSRALTIYNFISLISLLLIIFTIWPKLLF